MRYQGCHQYGNINLPTDWDMTPLLKLIGSSDCGYPHSPLDLLSCDPDEFKSDAFQTVYYLNDYGEVWHYRTNQIQQVTGLITYMKYIFESYNSGPDLPDDPFPPFTPDEWETYTATLLSPIQSLLGAFPHPDLQVIL